MPITNSEQGSKLAKIRWSKYKEKVTQERTQKFDFTNFNIQDIQDLVRLEEELMHYLSVGNTTNQERAQLKLLIQLIPIHRDTLEQKLWNSSFQSKYEELLRLFNELTK